MAITSAWWTVRSMRAVAQVALGKMVGQSLKARWVSLGHSGSRERTGKKFRFPRLSATTNSLGGCQRATFG